MELLTLRFRAPQNLVKQRLLELHFEYIFHINLNVTLVSETGVCMLTNPNFIFNLNVTLVSQTMSPNESKMVAKRSEVLILRVWLHDPDLKNQTPLPN